MKSFEFQVDDIIFKIRNPELNQDNQLNLEYKIKGIKENSHNDGYHYRGVFNKDEESFSFYTTNIKGKNINKVDLPEDIFNSLLRIYYHLILEREDLIESLVDKVLGGELAVSFKIAESKRPHYEPFLDLEDLPSGVERCVFRRALLEHAKEFHISDPYFYLKDKLSQELGPIESFNKNIFDIKYDSSMQKVSSLDETTVTSFKLYLKDLIPTEDVNANLEKVKLEKDKIEALKNSLNMEVIERGEKAGADGNNYFAIVKLTDPVTKDSFSYICKNIFNIGYQIFPYYEIINGRVTRLDVENIEASRRPCPSRELNDFEARCLDYLNTFPPIDNKVRHTS